MGNRSLGSSPTLGVLVFYVCGRHAVMSTNFARTVSKRFVLEYVLVPRRVNKSEMWVVEDDLIEVVGDVPFVPLSTALRGMAKAIGVDMNLSVPLGRYTWTDTLRELRTGAVN